MCVKIEAIDKSMTSMGVLLLRNNRLCQKQVAKSPRRPFKLPYLPYKSAVVEQKNNYFCLVTAKILIEDTFCFIILAYLLNVS